MSEIKVNKISPRTACGTTTLGDSGDTFTLPSGGTLTIASGATINNNGTANNFGATGSVNWQTTVKTGDFTAVSGEGYFVNTTSGAITVTLPSSPSAGAIVGIKDYAQTFDTNKCTLGRNGSKIGGQAVDGSLTQEGVAVTLVFIDSTQGWLVTDSGLQSDAPTTQYVTATGGTITTSGDFKIHTFTGPGSFCVSCAGNASGSNTVDYLVVAGGGGGGYFYGGGGGAGGARMSGGTASGCYSVGPLGTSPSPVAALSVPATSYPITVGGGGAGSQQGTPVDPISYVGINGSNSVFSTITSAGGGGGAGRNGSNRNGNNGGSGGGGTNGGTGSAGAGGDGNTPPVTPPQGSNGGPSAPGNAGAGGGAGAVGGGGGNSTPNRGGAGILNNINPATGDPSGGSQYYAGGGNPACGPSIGRSLGGGGKASEPSCTNGLVNTGSGGGGNAPSTEGDGGSGIVIIRYKFQN
jgi:hypothetical protein